MPGLAQRNNNDQLSNATSPSCCFSLSSSTDNNGSVSSSGFWSRHRDDISYSQLQKFWSELPAQARQKLLRIDKQNLFEQARKNMYCSRCNGLLLEGFLQIVMYGKSLQLEGSGPQIPVNKLGVSKNKINAGSSSVSQDETQDPSVHPWGGLTTTRDGALTLLDCYLFSKSLKGLQNVFDSARARERERELLYPDACGGGGRGWISQGMASYGRGHGTRETCALHTARLSCDTLVDFWSALGEETRHSLLRMKEEDFIERLMYRFDSKRFCRDCRRNVIREFKELKELKRMRRDPRCTSWFCVADTAFQYEVSNDTIHADWHQTFMDAIGTYHHFEWGVGTGEGKSDILEFENVGMSGSVQVNGLDLGGLTACYITLRAWRTDGRCTEISVKAHALKGQQCVHCRLIVGDGYVTITPGESIRRFFEHAEEAEEEEDDDSMDKDGNEFDGECSRPQKHAKSPELAREFLLDASTVIFKEQVEKAFREGTARQNAHSIFVCLALKLLEDRVHVACKEIITLEKQMKLLEEEEKEKREEEERKERKRTKEREKKLRRKERLRGKDKEKNCNDSDQLSVLPDVSEEATEACTEEKSSNSFVDSVSETDGASIPCSDHPNLQNDLSSDVNGAASSMQNDDSDGPQWETLDAKDENGSRASDNAKVQRRKKPQRELQPDLSLKWPERRRSAEIVSVAYKPDSRYNEDVSDCSSRVNNGVSRQARSNTAKVSSKNNGGPRPSQKIQSPSMNDSCGCNQQNDLRVKVDTFSSVARLGRETRKLEMPVESSKTGHRGSKVSHTDHMRDNCVRARSKVSNYSSSFNRDLTHTKKVWEPVEPQKKYPRSNSDSDVTLKLCTFNAGAESDKSVGGLCSGGVSDKSDRSMDNAKCGPENCSYPVHRDFKIGLHAEARTFHSSKETADEEVDLRSTRSYNFNGTSDFSASSSSASDNCSSCLSEGDSNTTSSNLPNTESSSTSDSEESSPHIDGRQASVCVQNGFHDGHEVGTHKVQNLVHEESVQRNMPSGISSENTGNSSPWNPLGSCQENTGNGKVGAGLGSLHEGMLPQTHNHNIHFPVLQSPSTMGYYHQDPVSWSTSSGGGLMPYPHPNQYFHTSPYSYDLSGQSPYCMQYGAVQHLACPLLSAAQLPVYQPVFGATGLNTAEQNSFSMTRGVGDACNESKRDQVVPIGKVPKEASSNGSVQNGGSTNLHTEDTGFSLFQFGPATFKSNSQSCNGGVAGSLLPNLLADQIEDVYACNKKETAIEEYNLFSTSNNGIKFSIF